MSAPSPTPSRVSALIDYLYSVAATALPLHAILLDPDDLTENPLQILGSGYGVSVEDAENTDRCLEGGAYYYRRNFTLVMTRTVLGLYSDAATRKQGLKDILEDLNLVLQQLKGTRMVNIAGKNVAFDFKFVKDSGPRPTVISDTPFLFIELTISAEYRET